MKKLKWVNVLHLFLTILVLVAVGVFIYYYSFQPNVPKPQMEIYASDQMLTVKTSKKISKGNINNNSSMAPNTVEPKFSFNLGVSQFDEYLDLSNKVDFLERRKLALETNIENLEKENKRLSDVNYATKVELINFFERNRLKDILLSALISAIISCVLTFILSRRIVADRIEKYFFKDE